MKVSRSSQQQAKRAIIYTRVSTKDQKDRGYSLQAQEQQLRNYCKAMGIVIVEHFQDDASAKSFDRPAFNSLLKFLKQHKREVDLLLVMRWDRFSRNVEASYAMIGQLRELGVTPNAIDQQIDFDLPEQKILLGVYLTQPDVENERRSLNTKIGMRRAMREGRYVSSPPKGYRRARDVHGRVTIEPGDDARFVRHAFREVAKGIHSAEEIRRKLLKQGFECSKNQFSLLLRNPVYKGMIRVPEWRGEEEEIVPGLHEGLVSEELFERVQDVLAKRNMTRRGYTVKRHEELPLRGYLQCSRCGGNLTGSRCRGNGGHYYYYHCRKGCKERFRAEHANTAFRVFLASISVPPEVVELFLAVLQDIFNENEGSREEEVARIESEIAKVDEKLFKVDEKFLEEEIASDSYLRLKDRFTEERKRLEWRLQTVEEMDADFDRYVQYSLALISDMGNYYESAPLEVKQKMIGLITPEKVVYTEGECRTTELNPAIALFCGNSEQNPGKNKRTEPGNSELVLSGSSGRTRTYDPLINSQML